MTMRFPAILPPFILTLFAAALVAGCGRTEGDLPVLRVGDQLQAMQSALAAAGEDKPQTYRIEWSNFLGGPAVIAAQTGGSLDLGYMAETPMVFAQAAGSPITVVAVFRGVGRDSANMALAVAASSPVRTLADLKGRKVGYAPGTISQYLALRALNSAGLSPGDIKPVRIPVTGAAVLDSGVADAFTLAEPMLSQGLAKGAIRVLAKGGEPLTPGFGYLVASDKALADPERAVLIADFIARSARALRWRNANVAKAAPFTAKAFNVSPEVAENMLARNPVAYVPIDASVIARHQEEADFFHRQGLIRERVDAVKIFDSRFNGQVMQAEKAP